MAMVVLSLVFYPLVMLATEVALRRVDGRLEEAALMVAPPRRVLWRITAPLVAPSVLAGALIVFVLAVSEFGVPGLLRVNVFTTEVFTAFSALYDFGAATALAVPLLAVARVAVDPGGSASNCHSKLATRGKGAALSVGIRRIELRRPRDHEGRAGHKNHRNWPHSWI